MPDDQYIHDAMAAACVLSGRAQATPLSEQHRVLFPSNFGTLVLLPQAGAGRGGGEGAGRNAGQCLWWWLLPTVNGAPSAVVLPPTKPHQVAASHRCSLTNADQAPTATRFGREPFFMLVTALTRHPPVNISQAHFVATAHARPALQQRFIQWYATEATNTPSHACTRSAPGVHRCPSAPWYCVHPCDIHPPSTFVAVPSPGGKGGGGSPCTF